MKDTEEQQIIESDKKILQSYKLTTIRNNFGIYAQRAILRVVEAVQEELASITIREQDAYGNITTRTGLSLSGEKKDIRKIPLTETDIFGDKTIKLDLRSLCPDGVVHFDPIREDLKALMELNFEYEDNDKWEVYSFLQKITVKKGKWTAELLISKSFWEVLLDMSSGFRRIEIEQAMKFRSVYSLRLFQLLSGQTEPITYDILDLKKMFGIEDKYKSITMFENRVIKKAKEELDKISPFTFDYIVNTSVESSDGPGRPMMSTITFKPIRRIKITNENNFRDVKDKLPLCDLTGRKEYELLTSDWFGFKDKEIKNNLNLLMVAKKKFKLEPFLQKLRIPASRAKNPRGYVIAAIKKELKESFGLILSSSSKEKNKVV